MKGKHGKISKTIQVYSNDPKRPQATLTLAMDVKDEMHANKYSAEKIFKEPCAKCHVDAGKGKKGNILFNLDCIMCHNYGKTASPLNVMKNMPDEKLRQAIEEGVNNSSMPGWLVSKSGPLTSDEINSLVDFIKGRK